ncbi:Fe-S cluster assembly protein SufD [Tsukamurella sp. 8F]|uniref:Fe-S cluster assembly protein SufD n=1 Tax=unclassified Tsukamurella TaxID=2633480 RepID=UPI0023B9C7E2|nr:MULTISPECIES: Fe-S cluster assembly protein SufD [unclassified Tsukamurella]MDF0528575.1 Fe-S cluster assembly protein SufD [Tsukamurella sp. 8J]MDF0585537.1 Fe-S cluster assembly protein SufD [Tsukamurella sp. 8F]
MAAAAESAQPVTNKGELFTSYDVDAFEIPSHRDEAWRFTPLRRLRGLHDGKATVDGVVSFTTGDVPAGITVETVGRDDSRLGAAGVPFDRVAAQAWSSFSEATVVTVGREVEADGALIVTVEGPGEGRTAFAHLQIRVERFGRAVVVLDHRGSGTVSENIEFVIDDGALLSVVDVQDFADDAVWATQHHVTVGRDATVKHFAVQLGGDTVRMTPHVRFTQPGGHAEMYGLYFADAGQHLEQRLLVDHAVPHCKSNVVYKGALQGDPASRKGDAHTVWVGDVLIRAEAEGTDTFELNRNLVLTDGARADSVPNLEIETGEIEGAGHASATGRFDDEQLFYLRSRGIPEDQARRLVVRGFFQELIERITVPEIRARLEAAIETELATAGV